MIYFKDNQAINFMHTRIEDRRATVCQIVNVDSDGNTSVVSESASMCNPRDNFSKEFGRKLALTKALRKSNYNKSERALIWQSYFSR